MRRGKICSTCLRGKASARKQGERVEVYFKVSHWTKVHLV